ncbi:MULTISPECIES: DHA2 family efflux MFS transporter permease subunit [Simplicispira]|jgi:EmrB/QacA subfamily drug resistance transporter|uniref:EmrB/QacA subfamily drug resistance transporter n=1 Tax=Simplicispira metamorpha TaxID=80881 RepID=A0A4V2SJJ4_9BURK|nr:MULTISPECIES: DHA2 family efflux MFS transporter permease subunit [Simplicispira]MBP7412974.1 DHA2 family efflux MFS transporter permease subunit [Giesbergeria sp.]MBP8204693.1 DHA2 family efflux MFS transporter permease subunit [Giesbergeria sp.]MDD2691019.1 DHA2 family efflux MFS transporter permease subunit [Simplicispira sp.]TCP15826.1 EmrB/QacA subfamily drug resistance transporter [Simplicispira metamorpha]
MTESGSAAALKARYGERYRWLLLLSVMVGTMASIMSSTVVNVAIPDMSAHFALGQERAQWVTSGFMVATAVAMLTTPWLLARYGYRATYVGAVLLLLVGGVVGGVASDYNLVLAARVIEGLAAGVVQPIPAVIILYAFLPHEQGRASGIFGMGVVLAPAIGPSVGGILVDWWGWRSIFFMVVPLCLASLWLAYKFVPITGPGGSRANRDSAALDWRGLLLGALGTLCLLNGLVALHNGPGGQAGSLLAVALLAFGVFIWWQRRQTAQGGQPLMDLRIFSYRQFAMGSVVAFIYGTALFGSTYLLPVFMQLGLHLSPSHVGAIMLPAGLVLGLTIPLVGRMADRQPTHWLVMTGLALLALSFGLMVLMRLDSALWILVAFTILGRIGLGFILPSLNLGAMRPLDKSLISQGSSAISFVRMLGGAAGVSLCGIVLEWRLSAHGASLQASAQGSDRMAAFGETFLMLSGLCVLALVAAWQLRTPPPPPQQPTL